MKNSGVIELPKVIEVDKNKCVNCHACISACPVKYCNDGKGDYVTVNSEMCIGCGKCLSACTHNARYFIDDFEKFINDIENKEKIVAIVAPSIASSFPLKYLNINGWLKNLGVEAVFDVSFGAELTVKSYVEHIKNSPQAIIAQPCPAIVTYIELYKPELLKYLAPADSPMLHAIKMIKKYYPKYTNHKIVVLSPCLAKKREFEETGLGDYNIGFISINEYFKNNKLKYEDFPETDFDNPPAERAVVFSSPGGLLETAERWDKNIREKTRKIEGVSNIYEYLDELEKVIKDGKSPLLIDCLNCEFGCNTGPLTLAKNKPVDEIEYWLNKRKNENKLKYSENGSSAQEKVLEVLNNYWEPGLYDREYRNLWANIELKYPNTSELKEIYASMHKYSDADIYNCTSCGYNSCEKMATAIFNGLNKPENCHFYLTKETDLSHIELKKSERRLYGILNSAHDGFIQIDNDSLIIDVNESMKQILKRNDLIGRSFFEFLDEKNTEIVKDHIKLREKNLQSSYEVTFKQSDGNQIPCLVSGSPFFNEEGQRIGSFALISDITELKKAEHELKLSRDKLEEKVQERTLELYEAVEELKTTAEIIEDYNKQLEQLSIVASEIDNAVIIMDNQGNFEWVNDGYTRMFGKTLDELINKNIINNSTSGEINEMLDTCIKQKVPVTYEFKINLKTEGERWIQTTITPILNSNSEINKLVAIDSDITRIKEKEAEILRQKEEIISQRDEIEIQRDFAQKQTENIKDSILYASRIQNAILPPDEYLKEILNDFFILFKPRDIVSGDFYWATKKEDKVYLAVSDCTGHGVPGAFMSILGISYLNEILGHLNGEENNIKPNIILNKLRNKVKKSLRQNNMRNSAKDGMDIALCIIEHEKMKLQYAGAYNPLYIIRNSELIEFKADKMPIGIYLKEKDSFTSHEFNLQKGDTVYMFTDGYVDQFGGANKEKFLTKNLKKILLDIQEKTMKQQKTHLDITIEKWMCDVGQIDDILIMGIKI